MSDLPVTTLESSGFVRFRFPRGRLAPLSGRAQLAQQFVLGLLKTPGAEKAAPDLGGGLRKLAGQAHAQQALLGAAMTSALSVDRQMRQAQTASHSTRSATESLASAAIVSANLLADASGSILRADIQVAVTSAAGEPQVLAVNAATVPL